MKKYFMTGLVILLPAALTIAIVVFVFNLLTEPFAGMVKSIFYHFGLLNTGFLFFTPDQLQQFISQVLILGFLFGATLALGAVARGFFMYYIIQAGESFLQRIPIINTIYKTSKDVIKTVFTSSAKSFKQVVLVPFPHSDSLTIGLITRENLPSPQHEFSRQIAVFVPTTPNPTSGFLMMYKPEDIHYLDMTVEEAFKFVVSCGVIPTPFKIITKEAAIAKSREIDQREEVLK